MNPQYKAYVEKIADQVMPNFKVEYLVDDACEGQAVVTGAFGQVDVITKCEAEDAIWTRDLQRIFLEGVRQGAIGAVNNMIGMKLVDREAIDSAMKDESDSE